jgi:hypothetical protein
MFARQNRLNQIKSRRIIAEINSMRMTRNRIAGLTLPSIAHVRDRVVKQLLNQKWGRVGRQRWIELSIKMADSD